jgi:hypothetical protein
MGTSANITSGPSELYIAASGIAFPALSGAAADFNQFTAVGFTQDGVEWDYTPSFKDFMVDERLSPVKKKITAHKLVVSAKLAEATLENLATAIPAATWDNANILTIGSPDEAPEWVIGWRGPRPGGGTRQVLVYRTVQIAATKQHWTRKDMVIFNVQFEALSEDTQAVAADLATYEDFPNVVFELAV